MIELSDEWLDYLAKQPETGMGYQIVSVTLNDGSRYDQVVVDSGFITRIRGRQDIPFASKDIKRIVVTHDKWDWHEKSSA
jgi:hypothetical protein